MAFVLRTTSARPDEHVAELLVRLRGLHEQVEIARVEVPVPAPKRLLEEVFPQLSDAQGAIVASGADVLARLDAMEAEADAQTQPGDDKVLGRARAILEDLRTAGFAHEFSTYEEAYRRAHLGLDELAQILTDQRFVSGRRQPSVGDLWVFALLVRFDLVYYGLYKCNRGRIADHPILGEYLRDLYQRPGFADSVAWDAIKRLHYGEDERINPKMTVPLGVPDLWGPHRRAERFARAEMAQRGIEENDAARSKGEWVRGRSRHRDVITADGSSGFPAEADRYHIYVSNNCPWCHRVSLTWSLKGLQKVISRDVLFYRRDPDRGWQFKPDEPGCTPDTLFGHKYVKELYERLGSTEKSVPVLYDKKTDTIVSNESAEIIRMLDRAFSHLGDRDIELYPAKHAEAIDRYNAWIYTDINNGAYKAGFTSSQAAYEQSYHRFFSAMERLDRIFEHSQFLCGDGLTEADVRLFPTMFRFDHVYFTRFRLDQKRLRDYPHLYRWLRDVLAIPGVLEASDLDHCRKGYFGRNANNIVPIGPEYGFEPPGEEAAGATHPGATTNDP